MQVLRATAVAAALGVGCLAPASPAGAARARGVACSAGKTVFRAPGVRAFFLLHRLPSQPSLTWRTYYACGPGRARGRLFYEASPATYTRVYGLRMTGERLGFVASSEGYAGGAETLVGWLQVRSGQLRTAAVNVDEEEYTPADAPQVPVETVHYAIAPDGSVAVLGEAPPQQQVAVLTLGPRSLSPPLVLFSSSSDAIRPGAVAIDETAVAWRLRGGQLQTAPV
jgi:hypothetical protein